MEAQITANQNCDRNEFTLNRHRYDSFVVADDFVEYDSDAQINEDEEPVPGISFDLNKFGRHVSTRKQSAPARTGCRAGSPSRNATRDTLVDTSWLRKDIATLIHDEVRQGRHRQSAVQDAV